MRYKIRSTGNGSSWTITRLDDGATLFLQGDDAVEFARQLDDTTDGFDDAALCDQYEAAFVLAMEGSDNAP